MLHILCRKQAPVACRQKTRRRDGKSGGETSGIRYRQGCEEDRTGHLPGPSQALCVLYQI